MMNKQRRYSCAASNALPGACLLMRRHLAAAVELARSAQRLLLGEAGDGAMNGADGADAELVPEPHPASVALDSGEDLLSALPDELKARHLSFARGGRAWRGT